MSVPTHRPETFGASLRHGGGLRRIDAVGDAPAAEPGRERPAVQRLLSADRANLIVFTFAPGQELPDHKAAHPITVHCLRGRLLFSCGEEEVELVPGVVCHLPAYAVHRVDCPADGETAVLLLTMLTPDS